MKAMCWKSAVLSLQKRVPVVGCKRERSVRNVGSQNGRCDWIRFCTRKTGPRGVSGEMGQALLGSGHSYSSPILLAVLLTWRLLSLEGLRMGQTEQQHLPVWAGESQETQSRQERSLEGETRPALKLVASGFSQKTLEVLVSENMIWNC